MNALRVTLVLTIFVLSSGCAGSVHTELKSEFITSIRIWSIFDEFTDITECYLVREVSWYVNGMYFQTSNYFRIVSYRKEGDSRPEYLGIIQKNGEKERVFGGGHYLASEVKGPYLDTVIANSAGVYIKHAQSPYDAVISTHAVDLWLTSGAKEVKFRRSDNFTFSIPMPKIQEFSDECLY